MSSIEILAGMLAIWLGLGILTAIPMAVIIWLNYRRMERRTRTPGTGYQPRSTGPCPAPKHGPNQSSGARRSNVR